MFSEIFRNCLSDKGNLQILKTQVTLILNNIEGKISVIKTLVVFGNLWETIRNICGPSNHNLQRTSGNFWKSSAIFGRVWVIFGYRQSPKLTRAIFTNLQNNFVPGRPKLTKKMPSVLTNQNSANLICPLRY